MFKYKLGIFQEATFCSISLLFAENSIGRKRAGRQYCLFVCFSFINGHANIYDVCIHLRCKDGL